LNFIFFFRIKSIIISDAGVVERNLFFGEMRIMGIMIPGDADIVFSRIQRRFSWYNFI